jgi:hypothetical protein
LEGWKLQGSTERAFSRNEIPEKLAQPLVEFSSAGNLTTENSKPTAIDGGFLEEKTTTPNGNYAALNTAFWRTVEFDTHLTIHKQMDYDILFVRFRCDSIQDLGAGCHSLHVRRQLCNQL